MSATKQPFKLIEVPLIKFNEEVIPYHQKTFEQHKALVLKLISTRQIDRLQKEIRDRKRVVKQLKDLMYELDTLRAQVEDADLDRFDIKTLSLRKIILNLVTSYTDLENKANSLTSSENEEESTKENLDPFRGATQIQLQENVEDLKLREHQEILDQVVGIQRDVEDLQELHVQLNEMVGIQREHVEHVEESIESTNENVKSGLKHLVTAHSTQVPIATRDNSKGDLNSDGIRDVSESPSPDLKDDQIWQQVVKKKASRKVDLKKLRHSVCRLKATAYPVTGAFIGGIIGGPIGLVAGLKVGSLAALGCAIAGYTGGRIFKKTQEESTEIQNAVVSDETQIVVSSSDNRQEEKKNI